METRLMDGNTHVKTNKRETKNMVSLLLNTLPPTLAWRYRCQSPRRTVTIKSAICRTCDPRSIYTGAQGMTAPAPQEKKKKEEVCIHSLTSKPRAALSCCYAFVVCVLSYLAWLENAGQRGLPPPPLFLYKHGAKYWWDIDGLCILLLCCFTEDFTVCKAMNGKQEECVYSKREDIGKPARLQKCVT